MKKFVICCFAVLLCILSSCTTAKQMALVQGVNEESFEPSYPDFVIGAGDEVLVTVRALNKEAALPFNVEDHPYMVDADGAILMPVIGNVNIGGKTPLQAQELIAATLADKLQNVFVTVLLPNASVVVLGEVNAPQRLPISKPVSIFEVIGAAQGFTANARCNQVEVLRVQDNRVHKYILDLTSKDVFLSPCFYLTKGDVVNVLPKY